MIAGVVFLLGTVAFGQTELKKELDSFQGKKFLSALEYLKQNHSGTDWAPIMSLGDRYSGVMVWTNHWNIYAKFEKGFEASAWMSPHKRSLNQTITDFTVVKRDQ